MEYNAQRRPLAMVGLISMLPLGHFKIEYGYFEYKV